MPAERALPRLEERENDGRNARHDELRHDDEDVVDALRITI